MVRRLPYLWENERTKRSRLRIGIGFRAGVYQMWSGVLVPSWLVRQRKAAVVTKRIHLATETGGRSRCRYTARPSIRAVFVPQEQFVATPEAQRCHDCQAKLIKLLATQTK